MAEIVLGIGTSHTGMLSVPPRLWRQFAQRDLRNKELVFPPDGVNLPFDTAVAEYVSPEIQRRVASDEEFVTLYERCQDALGTLAKTIVDAAPDVLVVITDDQDEWFYESNMPTFWVYWGESAPIVPRPVAPDAPEDAHFASKGYGEHEITVPVAAPFGRFLVEYLMDHDFDVAHATYLEESYGGKVARRFPTPDGEMDLVRDTKPHRQGLPHGFAFVVATLLEGTSIPIVPILQNTCYPPNQVRPGRAYDFGRAIGDAIGALPEATRVAIVASGGLSHFVVDEELDRALLGALAAKDEEVLRTLPRHRLYSATSESLNWVAVAGALADSPLQAEIVDYVPVYRTEAGTGGGWAFARWQ